MHAHTLCSVRTIWANGVIHELRKLLKIRRLQQAGRRRETARCLSFTPTAVAKPPAAVAKHTAAIAAAAIALAAHVRA